MTGKRPISRCNLHNIPELEIKIYLYFQSEQSKFNDIFTYDCYLSQILSMTVVVAAVNIAAVNIAAVNLAEVDIVSAFFLFFKFLGNYQSNEK